MSMSYAFLEGESQTLVIRGRLTYASRIDEMAQWLRVPSLTTLVQSPGLTW